jgi:hypothetical protein
MESRLELSEPPTAALGLEHVQDFKIWDLDIWPQGQILMKIIGLQVYIQEMSVDVVIWTWH